LFLELLVEVIGAELKNILRLSRDHLLIQIVQDLGVGLWHGTVYGGVCRGGCSKHGASLFWREVDCVLLTVFSMLDREAENVMWKAMLDDVCANLFRKLEGEVGGC
jgi:hypothetical protein